MRARASSFVFYLSACEELANISELVEKEGVYYKKNSNDPFNGKIDGIIDNLFIKGEMVNGKPTGEWYFYHKNKNLNKAGKYINGLQEGK